MRHLDYNTGMGWRRDDYDKLHRVPLRRQVMKSNFHMYFFNDFHRGANGSSTSSIKEAVLTCRRKRHSYAVLLGDLAEAISINDRRFSLASHAIPNKMAQWDAQRDDILELLEPIRNRILVAVDGNHERSIWNHYRLTKDIADSIGAEYSNGLMAKLIFPGFRMLVVHPRDGAINSKAGDEMQRHTNNLIIFKRRLWNRPHGDCDLVVSGHYHRLLLHPPDMEDTMLFNPATGRALAMPKEPGRIWIDREKGLYRVPVSEKYWMCSGAFLRAYMEDSSTYAEEFGMSHAHLGYGHIEVRNDKLWKVETVPIHPRDKIAEAEEVLV